jgi:hypothetical protein
MLAPYRLPRQQAVRHVEPSRRGACGLLAVLQGVDLPDLL